MERSEAGNLVLRRADAKLGVDLLRDALGEVGSGNLVDGNDDGAAQQTSEERGHPLRAILAPDQYLVVLADAPSFQLAREAMGVGENLAVSPALGPISAPMDVSHLTRVPPEVVEVVQDRGAGHPRQCNRCAVATAHAVEGGYAGRRLPRETALVMWRRIAVACFTSGIEMPQ